MCAVVVTVAGVLGLPARAFAQTGKWEVHVAPLYFWVATTDGNLAINGTRDVPVYMDFADAKSKLAGAFSFHGEARRGQWGLLGDINFIRLSTDVSYTTPILNAPIAGTLQLDQILFNGKATYEVKPGTRFLLVGGIRTLTMSPSAHFTGPVGGQLADIDISATHVAGVAGFSYRPRLGDKSCCSRKPTSAAARRSPGARRAASSSSSGHGWAGGRLQRAPHRHRCRAQERERAGRRRAVRRDAVRSRILTDVSLE